MIKKTNIKTLH